VTAGDLKLANRIVMAPLTRNRARAEDDAPCGIHAEYYAQRGGAGEFHREAQHRGRMMYPSVSKRRTVSPCQDIPTSRPRREIGSPPV
jgi:2,4-dienoyl-CoA reductase-like NADH-dependent reductase (Old Yellow Enzyme family)